MKAMLSNPGSAALISFILSLPITLLFLIFNLDMKPLTDPVTALLTVNGSDVNGLGRLVMIGGLLLLPVAFVINLRPMLKKEGPNAKRTPHTANLMLAIVLLLVISVSWGGLLIENMYCLQGLRCD